MNTIRRDLLKAGVRNLKEFGYQDVTPENIITVRVFAAFFKSMLNDAAATKSIPHQREIKQLLSEIDAIKEPQ